MFGNLLGKLVGGGGGGGNQQQEQEQQQEMAEEEEVDLMEEGEQFHLPLHEELLSLLEEYRGILKLRAQEREDAHEMEQQAQEGAVSTSVLQEKKQPQPQQQQQQLVVPPFDAHLLQQQRKKLRPVATRLSQGAAVDKESGSNRPLITIEDLRGVQLNKRKSHGDDGQGQEKGQAQVVGNAAEEEKNEQGKEKEQQEIAEEEEEENVQPAKKCMSRHRSSTTAAATATREPLGFASPDLKAVKLRKVDGGGGKRRRQSSKKQEVEEGEVVESGGFTSPQPSRVTRSSLRLTAKKG